MRTTLAHLIHVDFFRVLSVCPLGDTGRDQMKSNFPAHHLPPTTYFGSSRRPHRLVNITLLFPRRHAVIDFSISFYNKDPMMQTVLLPLWVLFVFVDACVCVCVCAQPCWGCLFTEMCMLSFQTVNRLSSLGIGLTKGETEVWLMSASSSFLLPVFLPLSRLASPCPPLASPLRGPGWPADGGRDGLGSVRQ